MKHLATTMKQFFANLTTRLAKGRNTNMQANRTQQLLQPAVATDNLKFEICNLKLFRRGFLSLLFLLTLATGNAWAVTIEFNNLGENLGTNANTTVATTTINGYKFNYYQCKKQTNSGSDYVFLTKNQSAYFGNADAMPGVITSVEVTIPTGAAEGATYSIGFGTSAITSYSDCNISLGSGTGTLTATCNVANAKYFTITTTNSKKNGQIASIKVTYTASNCTSPSTALSGGDDVCSVNEDFDLSTLVTGGNGGEVTYTCSATSGVSLSGSTANFSKAGTYTFTATQDEKNKVCGGSVNFNVEAYCIGLDKPTNLSANASAKSAELSWNAVTNATKYHIKVVDENNSDVKDEDVTGTSYSLSGLTDNTTYEWYVNAVGDGGVVYCDGAAESSIFETPALATYTITYSVNGGDYETQTITEGDAIGTLPTNPNAPTGCADKVFVGWSATNIGNTPSSTAPEFVSSSTIPTASTTYYAVFADKSGSGDFELVEKELTDWSGDYLIVYDNTNAMNTHSGNQDANTYATYTSISSYYTSSTKTIASNTTTEALVYRATKTANGYSLYCVSDNSYLGSGSGTGGKLRWQKSYEAQVCEWTLGVGSIGNVKYTTNYIRWDTGSPRFAIYESSAQSAIQLFKKAAGYTAYISTCCTPTTTIALAASESAVNIGESGEVSVTFTPSVTSGSTSGTWTFTTTGGTLSTTTGSAPFTCKFTQAGTYTITANYNDGTSCPPAAVSQTVTVLAPVYLNIIQSPALTDFETNCGTQSATQQVTVYGYNLKADVSASLATGSTFQVSTDGSTWATSATISKGSDAKINNIPLYIRLNGDGATDGSKSGTITFTTTDYADQKVSVSGKVKNPAVSVKLNDQGTVTTITGQKLCTALEESTLLAALASQTPCDGATFSHFTTDQNNLDAKVSFPYSFTSTDQVTFYAVYKKASDVISNDFWIASVPDELNSGSDYILTTSDDVEYALTCNASTYSGKMATKTVTFTSVDGIDEIQGVTDNTIIWKLVGDETNGYSFQNKSTGEYLTMTSSGSLGMDATASTKYKIVHPSEGYSEVTVQQVGGTQYVSGYNYTSYGVVFENYSKNQLNLYLYVRKSNYTYELAPCGPAISGTDGIVATSAKDIWVQALDTLNVDAVRLDGSVTISATVIENSAFKLKQVGTNGEGTTTVTLATGVTNENYSDKLLVVYKPTSAGVTDEGKILLRAYRTGGTTDLATCTLAVSGRSLPAEFVIAANTGSGWVALPNTLASTQDAAHNDAFAITVDNESDPTKATIAPTSTIYGAAARSAANTSPSGLRFTANSGYLQGSTGTGSDMAKLWLSPTNGDQTQPWILKSSNFADYHLYLEAAEEGRFIGYDGTQTAIGHYKADATMRILPVETKCTRFEAPVVKAKTKSTEVTLTWTAVEGATLYEYKNGTDGSWTQLNASTSGTTVTATVSGLTTSTDYTYIIRCKVASGENCSEECTVTFKTTACDTEPTISGGITSIAQNCDELTISGLSLTASSGCDIKSKGIAYSTDATHTTGVQFAPLTDEQIAAGGGTGLITISEPGKYYFFLYATNDIGTAYTAKVGDLTTTSLAGLKLMFENDNNVAPLVAGKASKRVVYYSESPAEVTWDVKFQDGTTGTGKIDDQGNFTATAMGVYTITATQPSNGEYCDDAATTTIEVRNARYHSLITNCAKLKNGNIEVVNQDSAFMDIVVDNAQTVKVTIVRDNSGQNTGTGTGNVATEVFFSKYYEATGNVKLIAIYNGTKNDIKLSNYSIKIGAPVASQNVLLDSAGHDGWQYEIDLSDTTIKAGKELIFWYHMGTSDDNSIVSCVEGKGVPTNTFIEDARVMFGGRQSIVLTKNDNIIDVIGAITDNSSAASANPISGKCDPSWGDCKVIYTDKRKTKYEYTWCGTGLSIEDETTVIDLAMNRCLLIRSNKVTSGANAVAKNVGAFNTFTPDEWLGRQVSKLHPETGVDDNGVQSSCDGFSFVADFDYATYFNRYEEIGGGEVGNDEAFAKLQEDGTYRIYADSLKLGEGGWRNLSCSNIKIQGLGKDQDGNDITISELDYKVPIIVKHSANTNDEELFGFSGKGRATCPTCDVVIRDNAELTVVPKGYNELRDVYVYHTGRLRIPDGKTYSVRHVYITSRNNEVGYALVGGTLSATQGVGHYKSIDAMAWYDFSLPYNCKVKDITRSNGLKILGEYTKDWWIKRYDGQKRAISGTPNGATPTNWELVDTTETLQAGVGYIIGIGGKHEESPRKAQYLVRITLPNVSGQYYTETGVSDQVRNVYGYTGAKAEELPCHRGWNYIGNPFISMFDGSKQNPEWDTQLLLSGYYKDMTDGETYTLQDNIYVSVDQGTNGATNWVQTTATEADLLPFRAFFVQAVSDGQVGFVKQARALPVSGNAPALPNPNDPSQFSLFISSASNGSSKATVTIGDYTPQYEVGYDMLRMINKSQYYPQLYTVDSVGYYMIYQAIDRTTPVEQSIALGYYTRSKGTFTISLGSMQNMDRYDAVLLIDNEEHTTTDLLLGNYTFTSAAGDVANRFSIRLRKSNVSTDIEAQEGREPVIYRMGESIVIDQLPAGATVRVIDAVGRVLHQQQATGEVLQFSAPVRGAYIIQVMSESQSYSIKTIL